MSHSCLLLYWPPPKFLSVLRHYTDQGLGRPSANRDHLGRLKQAKHHRSSLARRNSCAATWARHLAVGRVGRWTLSACPEAEPIACLARRTRSIFTWAGAAARMQCVRGGRYRRRLRGCGPNSSLSLACIRYSQTSYTFRSAGQATTSKRAQQRERGLPRPQKIKGGRRGAAARTATWFEHRTNKSTK